MPRFHFIVSAKLADERLDKALALLASAELGFSRKQAKKLLDSRKVRVDGKVVQRSQMLVKPGMTLEFEWSPPTRRILLDLSDHVLFQDEYILAISKPSGLPTHATHDPKQDHAVAASERLLAGKGVDKPYVAVHHRLDVDTSGVLVFGIDKRANRGLAAAFTERMAEKTYVALVSNAAELPQEWSVDNSLGRDRTSQRKKQTAVKSGDAALTSFRLLTRTGDYAWVEARPKTGRMHQIRVHLAEAGTPIVGDDLYGGEVGRGRLMLHARNLAIPHPSTGDVVAFSAEIPSDMSELAKRLKLEGL